MRALQTTKNIHNPSAFATKMANERMSHRSNSAKDAPDVNSVPIQPRNLKRPTQAREPSNRNRAKRPELRPRPARPANRAKLRLAEHVSAGASTGSSSSSWRQLDFKAWLDAIDGGKGFLSQYEERLVSR